MNLNRRTFFKRLGMLAVMPLLAKFLPEDWDGFIYTRHPATWKHPTHHGQDLTIENLEKVCREIEKHRGYRPF